MHFAKETGFCTESVGCNEVFWQKPGFWGLRITQETGFCTESVGCNESIVAKTRFLGLRKTNCKNMLQCFEHCVTLVYIRLKLSEVYGHGKQRRKSWFH